MSADGVGQLRPGDHHRRDHRGGGGCRALPGVTGRRKDRMKRALMALLMVASINVKADDSADRVRAEFLFSWQAYEKYAWGHDELRPISKTPRDWYGESL